MTVAPEVSEVVEFGYVEYASCGCRSLGFRPFTTLRMKQSNAMNPERNTTAPTTIIFMAVFERLDDGSLCEGSGGVGMGVGFWEEVVLVVGLVLVARLVVVVGLMVRLIAVLGLVVGLIVGLTVGLRVSLIAVPEVGLVVGLMVRLIAVLELGLVVGLIVRLVDVPELGLVVEAKAVVGVSGVVGAAFETKALMVKGVGPQPSI